ncbi:MAG: hypothetical protein ACOY9Y_07600 [Bacillota bacterium]
MQDAVKSATSRRTISISPELVAALKKHRAEQNALRLQAGPVWQDLALIFCTEKGTPINPDNLIPRHFIPLLEKAGLPRIRFHDLRHTHATLML